jgi:uncharacterized damage-inducible protein DinB
MSRDGREAPLIERYAAGGPVLAYAVSGLAPDHEKARPGPGDWSIAQLVAHLVDSDLVLADRMKRVLAEEEPVLQAFNENAWAERLGYEATSVEEAVNLLAANRHWMAAVLRRAPEADFARAGNHTERGRQTLAEVLSACVNHLDHHLRFLYAKRSNLGVAVPPRYTAQ